MSKRNISKNINKGARKRKKKAYTIYFLLFILFVIAVTLACFLFTPMAKGDTKTVYIDTDDDIDSVYTKMQSLSTAHSMQVFKWLTDISGYANNIHTGRYEFGSKGALQIFRKMRNGSQDPLHLTINSVRTVDRLAQDVSKRMMFGKEDLLNALKDSITCKKFSRKPETIVAMFIPNTYDIYWDISVEKFLERMHKESDRFWNEDRREKAKNANLSPDEVMILASIVNEETAVEKEMPMVAGMYINRLHKDMLLQADPTVKFATQKFEARRIYNSMLKIDSPYNTYRYKGLPPGPICIPCIAAIEAVLNYTHHDYIFMCAKEDFSGTHNFARTYQEHQANAAKYAKALNNRGIH